MNRLTEARGGLVVPFSYREKAWMRGDAISPRQPTFAAVAWTEDVVRGNGDSNGKGADTGRRDTTLDAPLGG